jgi:hypothetical protein
MRDTAGPPAEKPKRRGSEKQARDEKPQRAEKQARPDEEGSWGHCEEATEQGK